MKYEIGRCLLQECLQKSGQTMEELAQVLLYKPERLMDYMDNKRVMPLQVAISVADTVGCDVRDLYELIPARSQ